jgi:tetratricopeptide (TPR) repeat protein
MARQIIRIVVTCAVAAAFVAAATPAFAQSGQLRGKVVNEDGRPVEQVEIVLEFVGDVQRTIRTITDKNGEWVRPGLPVGGGTWKVTAKKGNLLGTAERIVVKINEMVKVPDIVIQTAESRAKGAKGAPVSTEEAAKAAKMLEETNTAIAAGKHDDAIGLLNKLLTRLETERNDKCAACHAKLGDIYVAKKDEKAAEAAYLKSIEVDPSKPGVYNALAAMYNEQRRFEEATKMGAKAAELMGASGTADPAAVFNQGVIFWNQSKIAEAKVQFAKAVELDPKMADAHYWLGMANVNQGNTADAKKNFTTYLELAPKGQHAETAKAILASIK